MDTQLPPRAATSCAAALAPQAWLLGLSGAALALHFGAWVWSVERTSLSHSLLFVSATPLILAGGAWLLRKPISRGAGAWRLASMFLGACVHCVLHGYTAEAQLGAGSFENLAVEVSVGQWLAHASAPADS